MSGTRNIVADASFVVELLLPDHGFDRSRTPLVSDRTIVHVPHVCDAEVTSALRSLYLSGFIELSVFKRSVVRYSRMSLRRHHAQRYLHRVHELIHNFSVYDCMYVLLARALNLEFATTDHRLRRAMQAHAADVSLLEW